MEWLAEFLVRAKRDTYASVKHEKEPRTRDGKKTFAFTEGERRYVDTCTEHKRASFGTEVVLVDDAPVWMMQYYGTMCSPLVPPEEVYEFLKFCLVRASIANPFRGPLSIIKEGSLLYQCGLSTPPDLSFFSGRESIFYATNHDDVYSELVFSLLFQGGYV